MAFTEPKFHLMRGDEPALSSFADKSVTRSAKSCKFNWKSFIDSMQLSNSQVLATYRLAFRSCIAERPGGTQGFEPAMEHSSESKIYPEKAFRFSRGSFTQLLVILMG